MNTYWEMVQLFKILLLRDLLPAARLSRGLASWSEVSPLRQGGPRGSLPNCCVGHWWPEMSYILEMSFSMSFFINLLTIISLFFSHSLSLSCFFFPLSLFHTHTHTQSFTSFLLSQTHILSLSQTHTHTNIICKILQKQVREKFVSKTLLKER